MEATRRQPATPPPPPRPAPAGGGASAPRRRAPVPAPPAQPAPPPAPVVDLAALRAEVVAQVRAEMVAAEPVSTVEHCEDVRDKIDAEQRQVEQSQKNLATLHDTLAECVEKGNAQVRATRRAIPRQQRRLLKYQGSAFELSMPPLPESAGGWVWLMLLAVLCLGGGAAGGASLLPTYFPGVFVPYEPADDGAAIEVPCHDFADAIWRHGYFYSLPPTLREQLRENASEDVQREIDDETASVEADADSALRAYQLGGDDE